MNDTVLKSSSLSGTTENQLPAVPVGGRTDDAEADDRLKIAGEQTIRTVGDLHKVLTEYLGRGTAVAVDLSEVDACDAAALQLIYAFRRSVAQEKRIFRIVAVSPAIGQTAAALGLDMEPLVDAGSVSDGI